MGDEAGRAAGDAMPEGFKRGADGKIRDAQGRFAAGFGEAGQRAGRAAGKGFGKGFGDGSSTLGRVAAVTAARMTLVGSSAAAAAPGVIHLTSALLPAAGAIAAVPVAIAGFVAATATLKAAAGGVGDAINKGLTGTATQYEKALEDLPPTAQKFTKSIVAMQPEITRLREAAASRLFKPISDEIQPLARAYFPLLRQEMAEMAGRLGGLGEQFAQTARKAEVMQAVRDVFLGSRNAVTDLRFAIDPLVTAFASLIRSTAGELTSMSGGIERAARGFAAFVQNAVDSGRVVEVIDNAKATLRDLGTILINIGSIVAAVFGAANADGNTLLSTFASLTGQAAAFVRSAQGMGALTATFDVLGQLGDALRTSLGAVLPAVGESLQLLGPALGAAAGPVAQLIVALAPLLPLVAGIAALILTQLTPALARISTYLAQNETLVKSLAAAAAIMFGVYKAGSVVLAVQAAGGLLKWVRTLPLVINLTRVWSATQALLNAALFANPIGLVVAAIAALVAGIVIAWKNSETFRRIVLAAWDGIKRGIGAVASWITGTVWPSLQRAWQQISAGAMWLWRNAILPAWNGIRAVINVVVGAVTAYVGAIVGVFRFLAGIAMWLWRNIFSPVFAGIRKIVEIWWLAVQVVFKFVANIIVNQVGRAVNWLRGVWNAVFTFTRLVIQRWWADVQRIFGLFRTYVIGPLQTALNATRAFFARIFSAIAAYVTGWWRNNISPIFRAVRVAWDGVATLFSSVYNNKIRPMFQRFVDFIRGPVVGGFRQGTDMIKTAWDKVREYARKPVAFVVNSVINPFIRGLNNAAAVVGVKGRVDEIRGFARGGQIPGPRNPSGRDNMLASITGTGQPIAVASREFITNAKSTMANLPLVKAINAKRGKVTHADVDPYLDGGDGHGRGDGIGDMFKRIVNGAKGLGEYVTDPGKALKKVADAAISRVPGAGMLRDMVIGSARRLVSGVGSFLRDKIGLGGGIGGAGVAGGWQGMRRLISNRFPGLGIISGLRRGARTLSGNRSYHSMGRAVDYPPNRALAAWIRSTFGARTKELITPFQELNLLNGRPHRFTGAVWRQHNFAGGNAHVHWAARHGGLIGPQSGMPIRLFDQGGDWPSGTLGVNLSGRTEYVDRNGRGRRGAEVIEPHFHFHGPVGDRRAAQDMVYDAWKALKRDGRIT